MVVLDKWIRLSFKILKCVCVCVCAYVCVCVSMCVSMCVHVQIHEQAMQILILQMAFMVHNVSTA